MEWKASVGLPDGVPRTPSPFSRNASPSLAGVRTTEADDKDEEEKELEKRSQASPSPMPRIPHMPLTSQGFRTSVFEDGCSKNDLVPHLASKPRRSMEFASIDIGDIQSTLSEEVSRPYHDQTEEEEVKIRRHAHHLLAGPRVISQPVPVRYQSPFHQRDSDADKAKESEWKELMGFVEQYRRLTTSGGRTPR